MENQNLLSESHKSHVLFEPVAIVALETLFPESANNEAFWRNIFEGNDLITEVQPTHWVRDDYYSPDHRKPASIYATKGGFIPYIDFDPVEFGIPPKNLSATDPSQLISLLLAKKLLSKVISFQKEAVSGENTSVIMGCCAGTELFSHMSGQLYKPHWISAMREAGLPEKQVQDIADRIIHTFPEWTENTFPGLLANVIAGRIANRLNLKGTNCVVDAACATSLAALTMACQELTCHSTDLVITGGTDAFNDIFMFECFGKTEALSPTGECRPLSQEGDGTLLGEGFGLFAIRRLEDAERDGDLIYAVIKSIGSSSDGKGLSIYAPLANGQALAIQRSHEIAGCHPREIELIEAHGTGTAAGDAAELEGLCLAFNDSHESNQWCAVGSIKSQIGHTKGAAGSASLFKTVMALLHKVLPPTIKIGSPLKKFEGSPFYPNTYSRPWIHSPQSSRKAGVSSFGFGGTNFHVILEEYRGPTAPKRFFNSPSELILLSGESEIDLVEQGNRYAAQSHNLRHLAIESQNNFNFDHPFRLGLIATDLASFDDLRQKAWTKISQFPQQSFAEDLIFYSTAFSRPAVGLLFSGQGSQYLDMGKDLIMQFEESRQVWDLSTDYPFDESMQLHHVVFPPPTFSSDERKDQERRLNEPKWALPAIGLMSLSQLVLLQKLGLEPTAIAGHHDGELAALFASGFFKSFEDFLYFSRRIGEASNDSARLSVAITAILQNLETSSPSMPVYTSTTGASYSSDNVELKEEIVKSNSNSSQFKKMIENMYEEGIRVFIEVGPQGLMTDLVKETLAGKEFLAIAMDKKGSHGLTSFWSAVGAMAVGGIPLDLASIWKDFDDSNVLPPKKLSKTSIKINGGLYQKKYPPKEGVALPNPECIETNLNQSVNTINQERSIAELQKTAFNAQQQLQQKLAENHFSFLELTKNALKNRI